MTDIQMHPIALIVIGWSLHRMKRQKVDISSIMGELMAVVFWLSVYPLMKWLIGKCFDIDVVSFWVYFRLIIMLMIGRVVEWVRCWGR